MTNRDRFDALYRGWQMCGGLISYGTFLSAVDEYERVKTERSLDAQFDYERSRRSDPDFEPLPAPYQVDVEVEEIEARERAAQRAQG